MKKVLMIYPEIPNTYWSFKYTLPFIGKKASLPPLGLLTVASLLPSDYDVKLIDMNVGRLKKSDVDAADLVFLSSMIIQKNSLKGVVNLCKSCNKPVVAGGPYPTSLYEKIENIDYFVLNEAEITLPQFIEDYERGCPKHVYRDERKPDITKTPPPRFDLLDINSYSSLALQFSRGCPFNCEFCDIIELFGKIPRTKLPEQFIHEMSCVYETGFRGSVFIVDDNFIGNGQKVKALLSEIIQWQKSHGYPFSFFTEASINCARDDQLLSLMVEAGFDMVFVGIETPHKETLEKSHKLQNLKSDIYADVEKIQRMGIEVTSGFIVGFDTDPEDIFDLQIDFIQKAGIPMSMIGLLTALPNTQLYRRLQKENRLVEESSGNNTHDLRLNFIPHMQRNTLLEGYKRILSTIYDPKNYFDRCMTLLRRLPPKKKVYRSVGMNEVKAMLLSLCKQTFSSYGFYYLRFLWRALLYNHKLFPEAVAMAVKGYHLFKTTEEILKADEFSTLLDTSLKSFQEQMAEIVEKWNVQVTQEMEKYRLSIKTQMQKKYQHLSVEMQQYLDDVYNKFAESCEDSVSQWKQKLSELEMLQRLLTGKLSESNCRKGRNS